MHRGKLAQLSLGDQYAVFLRLVGILTVLAIDVRCVYALRGKVEMNTHTPRPFECI